MYSPFYRSSWALVIGINEYLHLPPLNYAACDAQDVADLLIRRFDFPTEQVVLLQDEAASRNNILSVFDSVINQRNVAPDDRILVYFAGHGLTRQTQDSRMVGYVAPIDAEPRAWRTLLRMADLIEQASFLPTKHILFIMDACYSGLSLRRAANIDPVVEHFLTSRSVQVMTAGRADETVTDGGDREGDNSVFTGYLLEALAGRAATASGLMTASDVMRYVYRHVLDSPYTEQTPQYGWLEGDGDFVFQLPHQTPLPTPIEVDLRQGSLAKRMMIVSELADIASTAGGQQSALAAQRLQDVALTDPDPRVSVTAQRVLGIEVAQPSRPTPGARKEIIRPPEIAQVRRAKSQATGLAWLGWLVAAITTSMLVMGGLFVWRRAFSGAASTVTLTPPQEQIESPALHDTVTATVPIAVPLSVPTAPPQATMQAGARMALFQDDFSDTLNLWEPITEQERISWAVHGSRMELVVYGPYGLWISRPRDFVMQDAQITVDATILTAESNTGYGLVFRQVDFDNYYYYRLSSAGEYSLLLQRSGFIGYLIQPQWLSEPPQPGMAHQLGVKAVGPSISLMLDGELLASVQDSSLASGRVGLAVQTAESAPIGIAYDNFRVDKP